MNTEKIQEILTMNFWKEKSLRMIFMLGGGIILVSFIFIAFRVGRLTTPVILHFDNFNGIDLFGDRSNVWGVWFLGFIIAFMNAGFAEFFYYRSRILSYVFLTTNFFVSILLLVAVSVIVAVN